MREAIDGWELFDLAELNLRVPLPAVRVTSTGVLLLNPQAWDLLAESGSGSGSKVYLLFAPERREVGLMLADPFGVGSNVFDLEPNAAPEWPRRVRAARFVEHYRMAEGIWRAAREMTSGLVRFWAGQAVLQPAGVPVGRPPVGRESYEPLARADRVL